MSESFCVAPHDKAQLSDIGMYLCKGHAASLPDRFYQLADLHDDLAHNLTSKGAPVERRSKSEAIGIGLNPTVVAIRDAIKNELAGWARIVCEDRDVHYTGDDDIYSVAAFLATHANWIAEQPFIADLWCALIYDPDSIERDNARREAARIAQATTDEYIHPDYPAHKLRVAEEVGAAAIADTRSLRSKARSLLQPSGQTQPKKLEKYRCLIAGCEGQLISFARHEDETEPSKVWCEQCGNQWGPESFLRMGAKLWERKEQESA